MDAPARLRPWAATTASRPDGVSHLIIRKTVHAAVASFRIFLTTDPRTEWWFPASGLGAVLQPCRDEDGFSWVRTALPDAPFEYEHTQERIGARLCLDWKNGQGDIVQTWNCVDGNDNQKWSTQAA